MVFALGGGDLDSVKLLADSLDEVVKNLLPHLQSPVLQTQQVFSNSLLSPIIAFTIITVLCLDA